MLNKLPKRIRLTVCNSKVDAAHLPGMFTPIMVRPVKQRFDTGYEWYAEGLAKAHIELTVLGYDPSDEGTDISDRSLFCAAATVIRDDWFGGRKRSVRAKRLWIKLEEL